MWFRSQPLMDPELGELRRSGRYWKGHIALPEYGMFALALNGDREAPDPVSRRLATELPGRAQGLRADVQQGLFEHYLPYQEAFAAETSLHPSCPQIEGPDAVWTHVRPVHVLIETMQNEWTMEIAFATDWDVEHTVGAIVQGWKFAWLNGSVRGH